MVTKIEIRRGDPSTDVRSFAWPVLQRGDMSFPEGAYAVEVDSGPRSVVISALRIAWKGHR